jgi:LysR family transcriptional regulator, regulator of abg operon
MVKSSRRLPNGYHMKLNHLRDFVEIVEAGSLRAAARQRGVSQPVLTKTLRALESDVGARLLHRTAKGIMLTPSGRALLVRAKAVHMQVARAREEIAEIAGERQGTVAFGASASGLVVVPDALTRFRTGYPRSWVRIVEGAPRALLPLLRDQTLDFFLGPRPVAPLDAQVRARPLFRLPLVVAGRRGHPLAGAASLAALAGAPWLLLSAGGWKGSMLESAFASAGLPQPASITQCESYATAIALLSHTDTLGLIPRAHLAEASLRSAVAQLHVAERLPELTFSTYTRTDDVLTRPAAALMRLIASTARAMVSQAGVNGSP